MNQTKEIIKLCRRVGMICADCNHRKALPLTDLCKKCLNQFTEKSLIAKAEGSK